MARNVSLNWTNTYFFQNKDAIAGLAQVIERKVGDAAWGELATTITGDEGIYSAQDTDLTENTEAVQHKYRIVIVNGATRTNGNEITVRVLPIGAVPPVSDLEGEYVPEEPPAGP